MNDTALATVSPGSRNGLTTAATASTWKAQRELMYPTVEQWRQINEMCKTIAESAIGPVEIRGNLPKIVTVVLKGWELGLAPMQALDGIHIIKGRTELSADLKAALAQQRIPGAIIEWLDDGMNGKATVRCVRPGRKDVVLSYTWDDAVNAGITEGKDGEKATWAVFGPAMLRAFVLRNGVKMQYPEIEYGFDAPETALATREAEAVERDRQVEVTQVPPQAVAAQALPAHASETEKFRASQDEAQRHRDLGIKEETIHAARAVEQTMGQAPKEATKASPEGQPADAPLPWTSGPFANKKLSDLDKAEFRKLIPWLETNIPDCKDPAQKADREKLLAAAVLWRDYKFPVAVPQ